MDSYQSIVIQSKLTTPGPSWMRPPRRIATGMWRILLQILHGILHTGNRMWRIFWGMWRIFSRFSTLRHTIFNFIMVKSQRGIHPGRGDDRVKNQFWNPFYISKFFFQLFLSIFFKFEFSGTFNLERSDDLSPTWHLRAT